MKRNNLKNKNLKGFTLIELLVVITIIGILASIVVVNLNSARGKGQDTAIKEQMSQMRAQASLYYDDNFGYSKAGTDVSAINSCGPTANSLFANTDMQRALTALQRNAGSAPSCFADAGSVSLPSQNWVVAVKLRTTDGYWCVDAVGNAMEINSTVYGSLSTTFKCQ